MPRWKDLKRFCERDGWELYKDTDHYYYRKFDEDGNLLLTKVSRRSGEIRPHMWKEILKKQLHVTQEYFNSMIRNVRNCGHFRHQDTGAACRERDYANQRLQTS